MPQDENYYPSSTTSLKLSGAEVSYVPLKPGKSSKGGSNRSFGRLLSNAIEDVQLEMDRAVAERTQRQEDLLKARRHIDGIRTEISDRLYAKQIEEEEKGWLQSAAPSVSEGDAPRDGDDCKDAAPALRKHQVKEEEEEEIDLRSGARHSPIDGDVAESKDDRSAACLSKSTPPEQEQDEEEDEDPDFALRELARVQQDERLAHALVLAEARAQLRDAVVEQFDGDFARFLNGLSDAQAAEPPAVLQAMYVIEKWSRVEMTVNDVGDSVCVAVLLPSLINVSVDTEGHNSVIVQAERRVFGAHDGAAIAALDKDGTATSEYNAEYNFDGAQTAISKKTIEFEYSSSTGVLFVFIDQLRLRRQKSEDPKSKSAAKASAPEAAAKATAEAKAPAPEAPDAKSGGVSGSDHPSSSGKSQSQGGGSSTGPRSFLMKVSNKVNSMLKLKF